MNSTFLVQKEFLYDGLYIPKGRYRILSEKYRTVRIDVSHISRFPSWIVPPSFGKIETKKHYITSRSNIL